MSIQVLLPKDAQTGQVIPENGAGSDYMACKVKAGSISYMNHPANFLGLGSVVPFVCSPC